MIYTITMSFKAKFVFIFKHASGILVGLFFQYLLYKEIRKISKSKLKNAVVTLFFFFNFAFLLIPFDFLTGLTLNSSFYRWVVIFSISYQIISGLGLLLYLFYKWIAKIAMKTNTNLSDKNSVKLSDKTGMERRALVFGSIGALIISVPVIRMFFKAFETPEITNVTLQIKGLKQSLRIGQITDMHTGYFCDSQRIKILKNILNSLNLDLIFLTGDQLHNTHAPFLNTLVENFKGIKAKHGVFQVAGNHDHRLGVEKLYKAMKTIGVDYLHNENRILKINNQYINLLGVDDLQYGGNLDKALKGFNKQYPSILLSHRPDVFEDAANHGIDLVLAGHTHGGQICLENLCVSAYETSYRYGLYTKNGKNMFISSGVGVTGIPMRSYTKSEIVLLTLTA
jgi:uncharacterized protein